MGKVANLESMVSGDCTFLLEHVIIIRRSSFDTGFAVQINSSRADFRFCRKCKMFEIATVLSITHVSMCHTNLWSFPVLYSMPISEFPIPSSKNRFALAALFSPFLSHTISAIMARLGEKLQNEIEPVIRDFIDCMEPGTPRVEIESYRREDSYQVFIRFKKSLSEKHSLFKTGFKISSESDVRYL